MLPKIHIAFCKHMLDVCDQDYESLVFALVPSINPDFLILENLPNVITESINVFINNKSKSNIYNQIFQNKESLFKDLSSSQKVERITLDKVNASLAGLTNIYLHTFFHPIQLFLPHSSFCTGQFEFWNKINYLSLTENIKDKNFQLKFIHKLEKTKIWQLSFQPDEFRYGIKKRLIKEKSFTKKLRPESMIKAIIIRLAELSSPPLEYETTDLTLRLFLRYLNINKYIRVDRELLFLRKLENEIKVILANLP